jgi:formyl-CoA transferase
MSRLRGVKVPCGPIHSVGEALGSQQAQARDAVVSVPRTNGGDLRLLANPLKFSATPVRYDRPPPHVGQDTDDVLRKWGPPEGAE